MDPGSPRSPTHGTTLRMPNPETLAPDKPSPAGRFKDPDVEPPGSTADRLGKPAVSADMVWATVIDDSNPATTLARKLRS